MLRVRIPPGPRIKLVYNMLHELSMNSIGELSFWRACFHGWVLSDIFQYGLLHFGHARGLIALSRLSACVATIHRQSYSSTSSINSDAGTPNAAANLFSVVVVTSLYGFR